MVLIAKLYHTLFIVYLFNLSSVGLQLGAFTGAFSHLNPKQVHKQIKIFLKHQNRRFYSIPGMLEECTLFQRIRKHTSRRSQKPHDDTFDQYLFRTACAYMYIRSGSLASYLLLLFALQGWIYEFLMGPAKALSICWSHLLFCWFCHAPSQWH